MPWRWLREHFIGVMLAFGFTRCRSALVGKPASALGRGSSRVVVAFPAILRLHRVLVVAVHLPTRFRIDVADEDSPVTVERMWLAGIVSRVSVVFRVIAEVHSRGQNVGAVSHESVVPGAIGEALSQL
eukprot:4230542-Pleurochrysis_carterae.AAC.1